MFAARCLSLAGRLMFVAVNYWCLLFGVSCLGACCLLVVNGSLFVVRCSQFVVGCLLFTLWCLMCVFCFFDVCPALCVHC